MGRERTHLIIVADTLSSATSLAPGIDEAISRPSALGKNADGCGWIHGTLVVLDRAALAGSPKSATTRHISATTSQKSRLSRSYDQLAAAHVNLAAPLG
jgi:hypothetical protein